MCSCVLDLYTHVCVCVVTFESVRMSDINLYVNVTHTMIWRMDNDAPDTIKKKT